MIDNEIIKALESEIHLVEYVDGFSADNVSLDLLKSTIDLINRQKSEIERLKECPKCVYEYDGEISEYCIQGPCTNFTPIEKIKSEAYKEFAERLKEKSFKTIRNYGLTKDVVEVCDIDNLLKEMVGEKE